MIILIWHGYFLLRKVPYIVYKFYYDILVQFNKHIKDLEHSEAQLKELFARTLFDCSHAWGLTSSDSIPLFLDSLFSCI